MSSYSKNRSYRKAEDTQAFPDDFFWTLNVSNNKNGPRISKSITRQVKKNDKSMSRVCKRERSLDIEESYLINTPEVVRREGRVWFPRIGGSREHNASMFEENQPKNIDHGYQMEYPDRYDLSKRRMHKYMRSEDRFRRWNVNLINIHNELNMNKRKTQALVNSPNRK